MASKELLEMRELNKKGVLGHVVTDTPVGLRIRHVGSDAITSVTVTTATNIVLIDDAGTTTSTFAADTTIAAVAATINASANWECEILDVLGSKASASQFVTGANAAVVRDGVTVYDILMDTSASLELAYRLKKNRTPGMNKPKGSSRVALAEIKYSVNMGTAAVDSVQLWEISPAGVETQLQGWLSVDTTATTINFAAGLGMVHSGDGCDLLVKVKDAATLADASGNYLDIFGYIE